MSEVLAEPTKTNTAAEHLVHAVCPCARLQGNPSIALCGEDCASYEFCSGGTPTSCVVCDDLLAAEPSCRFCGAVLFP